MEVDRIKNLFDNKTIFISGATGFLGKLLIEKLLRVTDVKKLYLLVRPKKGKNPNDRMQEIFDHVLFSVLKKARPDSFKKCIIIPGDVMETDLGLIAIHRQLIQNEVEFIVHSAATTRFDDTVEYAVRMNTLGTKYMLDLAKQCKNLKLFIHISTAFAFPKEKTLYEKLYAPPADPHEVIEKLTGLKPREGEFEKRLMKGSPNAYTFSKALAEGLVIEQIDKLPIIIVRPAVVVPTYQEPIPGYFNNLQSPMGIFVGAGKGVIRSVHMNAKNYANLIPADCTINGIMLVAWDYLTTKETQVFNLSLPQEDLRIRWCELIEAGKTVVNTKVPFNGIMWYPNGITTESLWIHYFHVVMFQLIPAVFIDLLLMCLGYKRILWSVNQRLLKGQEMFDYFTTTAWDFNMKSTLNIRAKMNKIEKETYMVQADNVDIPDYLAKSILYARRHILKETDDMLPAAKRNVKIFYVLDRIIKTGFFIAVFYFIYKFLVK